MQVDEKVDFSNDTVLEEISNLLEPLEFSSTNSVFFDLVSCIADQQIHYRSNQPYLKKLLNLLNEEIPSPELLLSIDPAEFARKKIASNKLNAYQNLSNHWIDNNYESIDWAKLSDKEVKERLVAIKGIGEWTADMILMFTLDRPDIFNPNDYQLKKAMISAYGLVDGPDLTREMSNISESWKPNRSLAVRYLLSFRNYSKKK